MRFERKTILGRLLRDERGQTLPFTAVILVSLMGLSGMAVDAGHGYYAYQRLKVATNAATLAGAAGMPDTTTATTNVNTYSSATTSDKNYLGSIMSNVATTVTFDCASTVSTKLGVACEGVDGASGGYNALTVTQTATVKTWFGALFGIPQFNIQAQAMAAMAGGTNVPYNIAVIIDTTNSMTDSSKEATCTSEEIVCALQGLKVMLENMDPCSLDDTSCSGSGHYVDDIGLFTFPPVSAATVADDYTCPTHNPTIVPYTFPNTSPAYTPGTAPATNLILPSTTGTYEIIPFSNDYKTTDGETTLNIASDLAKAVGYSGTGCNGLGAPGGDGTYYAQAIYAAQAALAAWQTANPGSQNIMIILSDGDADACAANSTTPNTSAGACGKSSGQIVATTGTLNGTGTHSTNPSGYENPLYPSAIGQCGQAVAAAQYATSQGTMVYTIAFESETSGCATDQTYTTSAPSIATFTGTKFAGSSEAWPSGGSLSGQPCNAIGSMASNVTMFYSDNSTGCPAITATNATYTSIAQIFEAIQVGLTSPRLIPVGTT